MQNIVPSANSTSPQTFTIKQDDGEDSSTKQSIGYPYVDRAMITSPTMPKKRSLKVGPYNVRPDTEFSKNDLDFFDNVHGINFTMLCGPYEKIEYHMLLNAIKQYNDLDFVLVKTKRGIFMLIPSYKLIQ